MTLASGCVNDSAICSGVKKPVDDHVAALLADGGDLSVMTGQILISKLDAGCDR